MLDHQPEFTTGIPAMARSFRKHREEQGEALVAEYDSQPLWGYMEKAVAALILQDKAWRLPRSRLGNRHQIATAGA